MNKSRIKSYLDSVLKKYIARNIDVAYMDFPLYKNVGDQYIFLGAMSFLKNNGNKVNYAASLYGYSVDGARKNIDNSTLILCGGGGNFGDLYRKHQDFRNKILQDFPDNHILFLPQSIHYQSGEYIDEDMKCLEKHKKLTIMVRDKESFEFLKKNQISSVLSPDVAHYLYNESLRKEPPKNNGKCLFLLRRDKETVFDEKYSREESVDWVDLLTYFDKEICIGFLRWLSKISRFFKIKDISFYPSVFYYGVVRFRINRYFSKYDSVITSRLHGYIIAMLNDCEVEALDNTYSKIKRYKDFLESEVC